MKILLLQPSTTEENVTSFMYPPLGLIALAAYLQREKHEVILCDSNIENTTTKDILNLIKKESPQVVGLGAMSVNISRAFKVAEAIKAYSEEIITVFGGIHTTIEPAQVLQNPHVDFVVKGEGELTTAELLETLEAKSNDFEKILGLGFRRGGKVFINPSRPLIENLDLLPIPAYSLLDIKKYRAPYTSRTPFMIMMRSRGCPFECTFCGFKEMFGRRFRVQSPQRSIEEVDYLVNKLGVREIGFKDSEFTLNPKNVEDFCDLLIKKNYDLTWNCNGRVNHTTHSLMQKMKDAGCVAVTYGIESGDQKILDRMKKSSTLEEVRAAITEIGKKSTAHDKETPNWLEKDIENGINWALNYVVKKSQGN